MVQFLEGSLGFQVSTERGIPVCSRAERKPVRGSGGGFGRGAAHLAAAGAGVAALLEAGTGGVAGVSEGGGGGVDMVVAMDASCKELKLLKSQLYKWSTILARLDILIRPDWKNT